MVCVQTPCCRVYWVSWLSVMGVREAWSLLSHSDAAARNILKTLLPSSRIRNWERQIYKWQSGHGRQEMRLQRRRQPFGGHTVADFSISSLSFPWVSTMHGQSETDGMFSPASASGEVPFPARFSVVCQVANHKEFASAMGSQKSLLELLPIFLISSESLERFSSVCVFVCSTPTWIRTLYFNPP